MGATVSRTARDGVVKHPFSGKVEFVGREELAVEVAKVLDEHDPVTADYVIDMLYAVPAAERKRAFWAMPPWVESNLRRLVTKDGAYVWDPGYPRPIASLTGYPIAIDDSLEGLTFVVPEMAR